MSENVGRGGRKHSRKRGRQRRRMKKGNWFTRLRGWQKALVCFAGVLLCFIASASLYVAAKWSMIDSQEIKAEDLVINEEVKKRKKDIDLGEGYTNIALFGVDSIWERETVQTRSL